MTAAQKIAKEKFKKAIAYRQKTGVSLKEAFAHVYGKKLVKKKAAKKVVRKKVSKKVVRKKTAKKVGVIKRKVVRKKVAKRKKISETGILNRIHKVKKDVDRLDEAQHKHMMSGLHKIVGSVTGKYYINYITENGYKKMEFFSKLPKGYYKGMDRIIYVTRLSNGGTALIPVKYTDNNKEVKK